MKIAVIKLGARITWETDAAVGPGEAVSICKALTRGGAEVHVYTKILAKDTLDPSIVWHNVLEDHRTTGHMDALVVINGNVNFFGGAEDEAQIANYTLLNNFHGTVVYVMCDPELPLLQIWENVSKKPWGTKYAERDLNITRTDIHVLSQPYDVAKVTARWAKKKGTAPVGSVFHFPMERFPLLNEQLLAPSAPTIDLMYGGTTRGGRRVPNLYKWYWNLPQDISAEIFGKIDTDDFVKHPKSDLRVVDTQIFNSAGAAQHAPQFTGMVKYCDVLPKMNSALAHLVTGDPSYEELDIIPQRTYECVAAGNAVFIDSNMDSSRRVWGADQLLQDFLYVETQQELVERVRELKINPELRLYTLAAQLTATAFDADQFCRSLVQTIEAL